MVYGGFCLVHVMLYCRTLHGLRRNCMLLLVFRHGAHVSLISYTDLAGTDAELLDLASQSTSVYIDQKPLANS